MKQERVLLVFALAIALAVVLPLLDSRSVRAAQPIQLTYGTIWPQAHYFSLADQAWIDKVEKETKAAIKIKPFWAGTLVSPREGMTDATSGMADIVCVSPTYEKAGVDLVKEQATFYYGLPDGMLHVRLFQELWKKFPELRNEFPSMKVLAHALTAPMRLMSTKPVATLGDIKGMRIKAPREMIPAFKQFGAEGIIMPMTEVYESLQKGILGGAVASFETYKSLKLVEVVKYDVNLSCPTGSFPTRVMPMKSWNKLPPEVQKVFEANVDWWSEAFVREYEKVEKEGYELARQHNITFVKLPPADLQKLDTAREADTLKRVKELDAKGLPGTKMYEEARKFVKEHAKK